MRKFSSKLWIHLIQELSSKYFSNLFGELCIYKLYKGVASRHHSISFGPIVAANTYTCSLIMQTHNCVTLGIRFYLNILW